MNVIGEVQKIHRKKNILIAKIQKGHNAQTI